nr:hypothetical protein [Tanacetum cinerariifolium]
MDEALVPTDQRLKIGRSNFRLLSDIKYKESTLQLVYDVLRICPFFKAFLITADVRNKVNWHYVRDDHMFSTIKLVSRHQNTQQFGVLLPIELTNDAIRNSKAYKEYYAIAIGEAIPKPKAIVRRTRSSSYTSITPPTAATSPRLTASAKGKQTAKASKAKSLSALSEPSGSGADKGTGSKPGVPDVPTDESEEELSWNSMDDEGDDNEEHDDDSDEEDRGDDGEEGNGNDDEYAKETRDEESFDHIPQTPENSKDEGDGEEDQGLNISEKERHVEEEEEYELYKDVNINQGRGIQANLEVEDSYMTLTLVKPGGQQESSSVSSQFVTSMLNPTLDVGMESIFGTTSQMDVSTPTSVAPLPITTPTMTSSIIATTTTTSQAPILPTISSNIIQHLPSFGSLFCFDDRLRSLEENFSEFRQMNQFVGAVSLIPGIVNHYMDQQMNEAVKVAVQIQSDRLRDETQRENDEFLRTVDENIKKIIKEQVKEQVKVQVFMILPRIEPDVNEQLEAEVLTRSSHSSRTSYAVAANLFEIELKKILIEKMEENKSIQCSDEQRNIYKALVDAYESNKLILDTYGETVTLKRRRDDDADKDEEPSAGPDRGSKRRREGKEPESASALTETATRSAGRSTQGSRSRQASASKSALAEEPMQTTSQMEESSHPEFDIGADDQPIVQSSQHPEWFPQQQKPPSLDRDWNKTLSAVHRSIQPWISKLAKQADSRSSFNELMDTPLDFSNFLINRLKIEDLVPRTMWIKETTCYDKHTLWGVSHWRRKRQQFYGFAVNRESARDVYSKRRIIVVTKLKIVEFKIVEWHSYKHLDWITVRRDDDKLYKFKEGNFKRLRIQDIEDMLLLLVQGKLTNLTVEERFAFNVSL